MLLRWTVPADRFRALDNLQPPDDWDGVVARAGESSAPMADGLRDGPLRAHRGRVLVLSAAVVVLLAAAVGAVAAIGRGGAAPNRVRSGGQAPAPATSTGSSTTTDPLTPTTPAVKGVATKPECAATAAEQASAPPPGASLVSGRPTVVTLCQYDATSSVPEARRYLTAARMIDSASDVDHFRTLVAGPRAIQPDRCGAPASVSYQLVFRDPSGATQVVTVPADPCGDLSNEPVTSPARPALTDALDTWLPAPTPTEPTVAHGGIPAGGDLGDELQQRFGDVYGGQYARTLGSRPAGAGFLFTNFTIMETRRDRALEDYVRAHANGAYVSFVRCEHSRASLETIKTRLLADIEVLKAAGVQINRLGIDDFYNRMRIGVRHLDQHDVDVLNERYGARQLLLEVDNNVYHRLAPELILPASTTTTTMTR
jgi:Flp pilus assembly protein TadG